LLLGGNQRPQWANRVDELASQGNQFSDEIAIHIDMALVFCQISFVMTHIEQAPLLWRPADGVRQALKDQISSVASISVGTECDEGRGVSGVVGQREPAFDGKRWYMESLRRFLADARS
jgi:hypothetical protein